MLIIRRGGWGHGKRCNGLLDDKTGRPAHRIPRVAGKLLTVVVHGAGTGLLRGGRGRGRDGSRGVGSTVHTTYYLPAY